MGAAEPDALDQLGAEARELEKDATPEGAAAGAGDGRGAPEQEPRAPGGAPEAEVIPNPAPAIAAVLTGARVYLKRFGASAYSPALADALDDATIVELSDALGAVAVKYKLNFMPELARFKEEGRAAMALGSIAWRVYQAANADGDAARAERARDVTPESGGYRDPPNPASGQRPVEPGGA
jgi:hypothetical protein